MQVFPPPFSVGVSVGVLVVRVPVVVCSVGVPVVCPDDYFQQSYARAYIRAYTRTRTGIFR